MTSLFQSVQPATRFSLNVRKIAQMLNIPENLIVRVESWAYVIFVHRLDRGGQFISYRKLEEWRNEIAARIRQCHSRERLSSFWLEILLDLQKHAKQYNNSNESFWQQVRTVRWDDLWNTAT